MSSRAFTLIELLVALGIVILLVAISFPLLTSAQQSARSAVCASNLRQVGILLNTYLVSSNGVLPTLQNRESTDQPLPAMDTVLASNRGEAEVMRCPADDKDFYATTGTSYFWNYTVNGQPVAAVFSIVGDGDPSRIPLASDKEGFHPDLGDKINILYADGHAANEIQFSTQLSQAP